MLAFFFDIQTRKKKLLNPNPTRLSPVSSLIYSIINNTENASFCILQRIIGMKEKMRPLFRFFCTIIVLKWTFCIPKFNLHPNLNLFFSLQPNLKYHWDGYHWLIFFKHLFFLVEKQNFRECFGRRWFNLKKKSSSILIVIFPFPKRTTSTETILMIIIYFLNTLFFFETETKLSWVFYIEE